MAPILGYWNIRGYGQPIRMMLAYRETAFEDKLYTFGPAPKYDFSNWLKDKNNLGLAFPNLPYFIDGETKVCQSIAIMRYLARKLKLEPETEEEKMRADMIEQQAHDIRSVFFFKFCYNPECEKMKGDYVKSLPGTIETLSKFLGKRNWFASDKKLTYVDFLVYETLYDLKVLSPDCLDNFQNLKDFVQRLEELPTIQKFMESSDSQKFPVAGDYGYFATRYSKK